MKVFVRGLEAIAVLVPDFQTLGLFVPAIFNMYRCAISLGFPGTQDIIVDLLISLVLGYAIAVTLNLVNAVTLPVRPHHAPVSHSALRKTQFVCKGSEDRQVPNFDKGYLA